MDGPRERVGRAAGTLARTGSSADGVARSARSRGAPDVECRRDQSYAARTPSMMGRSHLLLAGAGYAALAARPLETPLGTLTAPVLGGAVPNGVDAFALSIVIAAA